MKAIMAAVVCAGFLAGAGVLTAGPLDRSETQPRSNPTTQNMIRVPGVVGMDKHSALSLVQQAGLNVRLEQSKKKPVGMEGKVVAQMPSPGGVAMYGTTLILYIFELPPGSNDAGPGFLDLSLPSSQPYHAPQSQQYSYPDQSQGGAVYQDPGGWGTGSQGSWGSAGYPQQGQGQLPFDNLPQLSERHDGASAAWQDPEPEAPMLQDPADPPASAIPRE